MLAQRRFTRCTLLAVVVAGTALATQDGCDVAFPVHRQSSAAPSESEGGPDATSAFEAGPDGDAGLDGDTTPEAGPCRRVAYSDAVTSLPGIVSYWRLDELTGTRAADKLGLNDGTYLNGVGLGHAGLVSGDPDRAASFDGALNYVEVSNPKSLDLTSFTLGVIVNPSNTAGHQTILAKAHSYWINAIDGTLEIGYGDATDTAHKAIIPTPILFAGTSSRIIATFDGVSLKVYWDGVLFQECPETAAVVQTTQHFYIGNWDGTSFFDNGVIDEVFVANRAITADEVRMLYTAATGACDVVPPRPQGICQ